MIDTFKTFLLNRGFAVRPDGSMAKTFNGKRTGRPIEKVYVFKGNNVKLTRTYTDTGEAYKPSKSFHVNRVGYIGDKFYIKATTQAMKNQAMRDLGLTMVRGPVSGKVYWE